MTRPFFTSQITIGNIIQVVVLVVGLSAGWVSIKAQAEGTHDALGREVARGMEREVRIRELENNAARADERYNSIMGLLQSIDRRLERIEGQGE